MNEDQLTKLEELRDTILNEVAPLATDNEDLAPAQRVELLMISAETAEDPVPLVAKAHEIALQIEDVADRADTLINLLSSIETLLVNPTTEASASSSQTDQKDSASEGSETVEAQPIPEAGS